MSSRKPPRIPEWLLERWASGAHRESLVGDLVEQYHRGRSAAWYWRQTVHAICTGLVDEARQHKGLSISLIALGTWVLPKLYTFMHPRVIGRLDAWWYPRLLNSPWGWIAIDPWAYRLQPYRITSNVAWCALLAAATWITARSFARQRGLIMILLVITQVGLRLPYLRESFMTWLHEPDNPMWLFAFLWFALLTFVLIPFSIVLGGAATLARHSVGSVVD